MWATLLTQALSTRLGRDPRWREFTLGLFGDPERRDAAVQQFAALLPDLRELLGRDPEAVLAELVEDARFRPAGG
jgi:hypothetical protein